MPAVDSDWGIVVASRKGDPLYAQVLECIVTSAVEAQDDEQFREAAKALGNELAIWWASVSDWLGVLTMQDFVGLGTTQRSILAEVASQERCKSSDMDSAHLRL